MLDTGEPHGQARAQQDDGQGKEHRRPGPPVQRQGKDHDPDANRCYDGGWAKGQALVQAQ
jgi:hypothetical protein